MSVVHQLRFHLAAVRREGGWIESSYMRRAVKMSIRTRCRRLIDRQLVLHSMRCLMAWRSLTLELDIGRDHRRLIGCKIDTRDLCLRELIPCTERY